MFLIVGLGNPGAKFEKTRHNVGFMALDIIAKNLGQEFIKKGKGEYITSDNIILLKPLTYMNNSGEEVSKVLNLENIDKIAVIYDDIALNLGRLKINSSCSSTHNGIRSIKKFVDDFINVRIGIGSDPNLSEYVLSDFKKEERSLLDIVLENSAEAVMKLEEKKLEDVQNEYNRMY